MGARAPSASSSVAIVAGRSTTIPLTTAAAAAEKTEGTTNATLTATTATKTTKTTPTVALTPTYLRTARS